MTAKALAATHAAAFAPQRGWSAQEFQTLLDTPGILLTGDPTAFVLGRITLDEAEILTLATHPDHRRYGHAKGALQAFEETSKSKGARTVFLEVAEDNTAARALYASAGYSQAGKRDGYYPRQNTAPVAALILSKTL